jgi:transposase
VDHQPRPGVRAKERRRDRLIALARAHPTWAWGFEDETWWSRLARPALHAWAPAGAPLRLVERAVAKTDPGPKALACYGLLVQQVDTPERLWLRFVDGRPVSAVTTQFLAWSCERLAAQGTPVLVLVWDNASWHVSEEVRGWIRAHNRQVKAAGRGVRILACYLPTRSPWLNPMEPKWVHGKRRVVEPTGLLTAHALAERVCAAYGCPHDEHLTIPNKAA